ncbi:multidrug effflux MFS transporter [Sphingomonas carotinifaciens]|uniref:MFS transporter n=1 Tax=Sphingomonas carotinifaciens TaxID=1166323 RepID=A0A1G7FLY1_9SPHN|nr:multidrug effflux MFS transporter [Sphingomonas carotinifaciens]MBB4086148.1 DHA1 family bicyclomycin/chloramphenicol resistance-like MFS transporter [Sphingomonas carotinifaciens]MWC42472.1 MFS transporter [Sphingomonas carotinifaciens]SDE76912.1 MFS transporter, DHA1 family, bicyclomycin/chloramphenicol resistance protein [Sphingomonas carotinifaciens]
MTDSPSPPAPDSPGAPIGFVEFVLLVAALMALAALGIDSMLPALPAIGDSLDVRDPNARQFVITAFLIGFGVAQLAHGPLADRFGRRRVLICALVGYVIANALAAVAGSFTLLLAARVCGGAAVAATRVATVALVRDCYQGRAMAKVMSIAFMVFMVVPVLAPAFGEFMLIFGRWRVIFWAIAGLAALVLAWFAIRMPETLVPERRLAIAPGRIARGWLQTVSDRLSLGYTLASTALMGALYGYLNSVQQIMAETFGRPALLAVVFATTAATMAVANLLNSQIVMRLGTRLISHGAVTALILLSAIHLAVVWTGHETLWAFGILQGLTMACFGLATSNFSAMAMENMGGIAGTASSVQGFTSITFGSVIGALIGQAFDGTPVPLVAGFLVAGLIAFGLVFVTERGHVFRRG